MSKLKYVFVLFMLTGLLFVGSPKTVGAAADGGNIPAIVFVQDKESGMLLNHNFEFDGQIHVPGDTTIDSGFSVTVPSEGI